MNWFLKALKNYAGFSGRSQRSEYWYFVLFYMLIYIVLAVIDAMVFGAGSMGILSSIYSLALFIPSLAVSVRRLHDTDRSGWWILIGLVPLIGWIVLIVFFVMDSTPGSNRFGPNPKGA